MKQLGLFFLLVITAGSCKPDGIFSRSGELCFNLSGNELRIENNSSETMHFDVIDQDLAARSSRTPFDCENFNILKPGKSVTFRVDSLVEKSGTPVICTWWQCNGNKLSYSGNSLLKTTLQNQICAKPR